MIRDTQVTLAETVTWYSTAVGVVDSEDAEETLEGVLTDKLDRIARAFSESNTVEEEEVR